MRLTSPVAAAVATTVAVAAAATLAVSGAAAIAAAPTTAKVASTATRTAIAVSARPVATTPTRLTVTVTPQPAGGTVAFRSNGATLKNCGAKAVTAGKAVCAVRFLTPGTKKLSVTYSGRAPFKASSRAMTITVAKAPGSVVGGVGSCTTSKGALVGVDFAHWGGPIVRGCDTTPTTGSDLLKTAHFTVTGTQRYGTAFVCRLANPLFNGNTSYPTASTQKCVNTPPASAYWSYWLAPRGSNTWKYSTLGVNSHKATAGEVEAWTFGATDVAGTTGKPTFTPNQLRAGLPSTKVASFAQRAAGKTFSLSEAVGYLTSKANLADGTHYEPFGPGFTDFGLTIDGAYAIAAAGTDDATFKAVVGYIEKNADDWTSIKDAQYANGGAIGKEALLAEIAGADPRNFNGHDLIKALDGLVCTTAVKDVCEPGNYRYAQSTFSQALAVMAQLRAGDTAGAAKPVAYLESLQNENGSFPSIIPSGGDSDIDSTAMAAMALTLVKTPAATKAVAAAAKFIAGKQHADGSFTGTAGISTNTAGLAIQGMSLAGSAYRTQIDKAETFLGGLQNADGGFPVNTDKAQPESDLRASTQSVGGLVATSFATLTDDVSAPAPSIDASKTVEFAISKLSGGTHFESGGYIDYGGTADFAIALAAEGKHDSVLKTVLTYLRAHVVDYADPNGTTQYPGPYSGSLAKLAVLAEITGQDPHSFGGFDLLKNLANHLCTKADSTGACTAPGDFYQSYSSTSQSLGVLAFARAGEAAPAAAVKRLEQLQCADGGFSSTLFAPGGKCTSDVDATGFAVQALTLLPSAGTVVHDAVAYLRSAQLPEGGWNGASGKNNTNSTALAMQGLLAAPAAADSPAVAQPRATQSDPAVKRGFALLATLQNTDGGFGISPSSTASDVRATNQAVPAALFATLTRLSHKVMLAPVPPASPSSTPTGSAPGSASGSAPSASTTDPGGITPPGSASSSSGGGALANTGAPTQSLLGYALALVALGLVLSVLGRRRRTARHAGRHNGRHSW